MEQEKKEREERKKRRDKIKGKGIMRGDDREEQGERTERKE